MNTFMMTVFEQQIIRLEALAKSAQQKADRLRRAKKYPVKMREYQTKVWNYEDQINQLLIIQDERNNTN